MRLFNKRTKKQFIRREKTKGVLNLEGRVQWEGDLKNSATAELLKERKLDKKREDKKFARRRAQ